MLRSFIYKLCMTTSVPGKYIAHLVSKNTGTM